MGAEGLVRGGVLQRTRTRKKKEQRRDCIGMAEVECCQLLFTECTLSVQDIANRWLDCEHNLIYFYSCSLKQVLVSSPFE